MEKWAERIQEQIAAKGLNLQGLAKACGKSQPSVWQWFNDSESKPATKMIMADNAVAAARYLGTSVEYLMTGVGVASPSQSVGFDPTKLATSIAALRHVAKKQGWEYDPETHPVQTLEAYQLACALPATPSTADVIDFGERVAELLRRRE